LRIQEERRKYGAEVQKETDSLKQQFDMLSMTAAEQEIANRQLAMRNEYLDAGNKLMQQMADVDMSKMSDTEKEKAKREEIEKNAVQRANRILQAENQLDWRLLRPIIKVPTAYDEYVMKEKMKKEVKDELKEEREKEKMRQKQIKELNAIWESPRAKSQKRSKSKPSKDRAKAKSPKRAKSPKKVKGKNKGKK
jgi:hypothetical protein